MQIHNTHDNLPLRNLTLLARAAYRAGQAERGTAIADATLAWFDLPPHVLMAKPATTRLALLAYRNGTQAR